MGVEHASTWGTLAQYVVSLFVAMACPWLVRPTVENRMGYASLMQVLRRLHRGVLLGRRTYERDGE